jgi:hypothetical protein
VSGKLHALAALPPGKDPRCSLGGSQSRSGQYGKVKVLGSTGSRTPIPRSSSPCPVAIPTALPRLLIGSAGKYWIVGWMWQNCVISCPSKFNICSIILGQTAQAAALPSKQEPTTKWSPKSEILLNTSSTTAPTHRYLWVSNLLRITTIPGPNYILQPGYFDRSSTRIFHSPRKSLGYINKIC